MNRETTLAAGVVGVVAVALLVAAVVPGALADPTDEGPTRPGAVDIAEVAIEPGAVSGATATLRVETRLAHRGNPTQNVTMRVRAVDGESGLVETTQTVAVGNLTGDREVPVTTNLTVAREGGYRIETVVYRDGERIESGGRTIDGLEALTPAYARTSVAFTDSDVLPPVAFSVAEVGADRTTLALAASLTNRGDDVSEDLEVTLILRQAESNIVAARQTVTVGSIRPGRTQTVETDVTVPSGYNYYIDAVLWKDDVMVDSTRSVANLNPTETIRANQTEREVELEVSDFQTDRGAGDSPMEEPTRATETAAPGFGVAVAVAALLASALLARRRHR